VNEIVTLRASSPAAVQPVPEQTAIERPMKAGISDVVGSRRLILLPRE
jgi:hypothetical protein